jgi:hypothetical protein
MKWVLRAEAACRRAVRKRPSVRMSLAVFLPALLVCLALLPLLLTQTSSLPEAHSACWELAWENWLEAAKDMDEKEAEEYLEGYTSNIAVYLNPSHGFNIASAAFSLFCFLLWMFITPHTSSSEARLDLQRKPPPPPTKCKIKCSNAHTPSLLFLFCLASNQMLTPLFVVFFVSRRIIQVGSFYGLQVLGHFCVVASVAVGSCPPTLGIDVVSQLVFFLTYFGISILGTNLLCHRYLLEKAKTMSKMYVPLPLSLSLSPPPPTPPPPPRIVCVRLQRP